MRSTVKEVRIARILLCIAFTPAHIVLAPPMSYALLPLLFVAGFIASQFLDLKHLYCPWLSYLSHRQAPFTLIMGDLDGFKHYNDRFGHPAGDEALKKVGALLKESLRPTEAGFRYGGEEFVVIVPDVSEPTINYICARIKKRVSKEVPGVGISFGKAFFPKDGTTVREVIETADKRLYEAKQMSQLRRTAFEKEEVGCKKES